MEAFIFQPKQQQIWWIYLISMCQKAKYVQSWNKWIIKAAILSALHSGVQKWEAHTYLNLLFYPSYFKVNSKREIKSNGRKKQKCKDLPFTQ